MLESHGRNLENASAEWDKSRVPADLKRVQGRHRSRGLFLANVRWPSSIWITINVAAALVRTQGPSKMDRTFYSRSTLSLLIVWQDQFLFQAAHTGPSPNVKQDLM